MSIASGILCASLAVVLSCSALPAAALPAVSYHVPTYTYGPAFVKPAAVDALNSTYYSGALPALNLSWPVIKLAGVITLNGQYNTLATLFQTIYMFFVDMINAHGGILVAGTPHLLSITWASDDSSMAYLEYLYAQWMNDPQYTAYLSPQQDPQLQALNALIVGSNRTFINAIAMASANFAAHYPYIFSALQPREQTPIPSIMQLNQRAQQYHNDVASGAVQPSYDGETTSQWGIQNVCMYTHNDPAQLLICNGLRAWINATNQARLAAGASQSDLIVIEQDVLWNIDPTAVDQNLYTNTLNNCPDHVDVLVVCGQTSTPDAAAVAAALAATELRPKAAFTLSLLPSYDPTNATLARLWTGWTTLTAPNSLPSTLPAATFSTITQANRDWSFYYNITTTSIGAILSAWPTIFEIFKAALSTTASLSSSDLRTAFLALNGTRSYSRPVNLDPLTGVNDGSVTYIAQLNRTVGPVLVDTSLLIYPYDWPWSRLQIGDALVMAQSSTNVIIGWVLVMLGCWVAQILVEQAVFVRRRGGWYQVWLGVVATSLGGAGVWCSQWTMSSAVTLTRPDNNASIAVQFSLDVALLALLPALILTWLGLMVLMRDVEDSSAEVANAKHSAAHVARQINKEQRAEKRKRAALSPKAHLYHLRDSVSLNALLGGVLVAVGVDVCRVTLFHNWTMQATVVSSAAAWAVSVIVEVVLLVPALLMYFHALKWRTAAVFMLSGAVMIDWQVQVSLATFEYAAATEMSPSSLYTLLLSATAVQIITGIITAVTCFGFIGLQFSRMQLSRNGLSILVASLENVINKLKAALQQEQQQSGCLRVQADELVRMVEAINIVRPIPKEYAWALASCSNTSTFLRQHEQDKTAGAKLSTTSSTAAAQPNAEPHSRLSIHALNRRQSHTAVTVVQVDAVVALAKHRTDSLDVSRRNSSSMAQEDCAVHPSAPLVSTQSSSALPGEVSAATKGMSSPSVSMRTSKQGWTDSQMRKAEAEGNRDAAGVTVDSGEDDAVAKQRGMTMRSSHAQAYGPASSPVDDSSAAGQQSAARADEADGAERSSHDSQSVASLTAVGQVAQMEHHSRRKQMEADLVALLTEQAQHAATAAPENPQSTDAPRNSSSMSLLKGRSHGPSAEDLEFTTQAAIAKPTMAELLAHPVCVELLKDELERIHSVENLVFYLHAVRYRQLDGARARRLVAQQLFDTFVAEGSPQQINISTRQRDQIQAQLKKRGDDVATPQLFREAEREVASLMEANVMKSFVSTPSYRLCSLVLAGIDIDKATGRWAAQQPGGQAGGWGDSVVSLLTTTGGRGSQLSRQQDVEASAIRSSIKRLD